MLKKNTQITVFVIIGIISIIVGIGAYFLLTQSEEDMVKLEQDKVNNLIQDCVKKYGENGISLLGQKGGFIYIPSRVENDPFKTVDLGFKVPIWQEGLHPSLNSMENDLSRFVEEQSLSCIKRGLREYEGVFNYTFLNNMSVNTTIKEENVVFDIDFPIKITLLDTLNSYSIDSFNVDIKSKRLKKSFEIASKIIEKQIDTKFLENLVIEQIQTASNYDDPIHSMPAEGMVFSCRRFIWTIPQLQENLVNLNNNNFKYLNFQGTASLDVPDAHKEFYVDYYKSENVGYSVDLGDLPSGSSEFRVLTFVPSSSTISGYEQSDNFFTFKKFEVTPNDGGVTTALEVEVGDFKFPIPCIQIFHHLYDIDYAIVFQIQDTKDNFIFQFPVRVQISRNQPAASVPFTIIDNEDDVSTMNNRKFCSKEPLYSEEKIINGNLVREEIPSLRSYPLKISVKDKFTGEYVDNVTIIERCVGLKCEIGQTQIPTFMGLERAGAAAELYENFSYCENAKIIAQKEGYASNEIFVNINDELKKYSSSNPVERTIEIVPEKTFEISQTVALKDFETGEFWRLADGEMVYVSVEANGFDYKSTAIVPTIHDDFKYLKTLMDPTLTYNLSAYYLDSDYGVQGMLNIDNWKPIEYDGNVLMLTIPSKREKIVESENFMRFYDYAKEYSNTQRITTY